MGINDSYTFQSNQKIAGLKNGLAGRIEGGRMCDESAGISFGSPVFGYEGDAINVYGFKLDTAVLAASADLSASNSTIITVNGVATTATVYGTSHAATMAAIIVKLNALTGVEAVLDSADGTGKTILIRTKGATATVSGATTGGTAVTWSATYASGQVFLGVAMFIQKASSLGAASALGYEQYDQMAIMADGEIMVVPAVTVEANSAAYVDNASTDIGKFTVAANGVAVAARYLSNGGTSTPARLLVTGQTNMTYAASF